MRCKRYKVTDLVHDNRLDGSGINGIGFIEIVANGTFPVAQEKGTIIATEWKEIPPVELTGDSVMIAVHNDFVRISRIKCYPLSMLEKLIETKEIEIFYPVK